MNPTNNSFISVILELSDTGVIAQVPPSPPHTQPSSSLKGEPNTMCKIKTPGT